MKDLGNTESKIGSVDSKFRFVIIAAKRARQLLKGAKPKIKSKSHNDIIIAQEEVLAGVVEYEILPVAADEVIERDEGVPVVAAAVAVEEPEEIIEPLEEEGEAAAGPEADEEPEEELEEEEEAEGLPDLLKEDKDD